METPNFADRVIALKQAAEIVMLEAQRMEAAARRFSEAVFAKFVAHPHIPSIAIFGEKRCNLNISRHFWHVSVS